MDDYPENPTTFGEHLKKKRLDEKLTRSQLSHKLGLTKSPLWMWENTDRLPTLKSYPRVIQFIGYDPLFDNSGTLRASIKNYRRANGLTLEEMATLIGIRYAILANYLKDRNISKRSMKKIQQFFEETSS